MAQGGHLLWRCSDWRVVRATEAPWATTFPTYYRVVASQHVAELSDMAPDVLQRGMSLVMAVERAIRRTAQPDKINVASLGNQVRHVHWHVVSRHADDTHYPDAIWSAPRRAANPDLLARWNAALPTVDAAVVRALDAC